MKDQAYTLLSQHSKLSTLPGIWGQQYLPGPNLRSCWMLGCSRSPSTMRKQLSQMHTFLQWVPSFIFFGLSCCSLSSLLSLIVLDPVQKMNHFRRHWDAALQAVALVEVEKTLSSSWIFLFHHCIATLWLWVGIQPISSSHPPIWHICMVPYVCHWPHFIWVHPRIPMAHPVHPTWLTVQLVVLSGPHIHCQTGHSARTPWMVAHHQGYRS